MCLRVLNCLERDRCRYLKEFHAAFGLRAQCYSWSCQSARSLKRARFPLNGHFLLTATIIAYCFTTRTPVSVLTLFIAAATHTFQTRSPSSIFSCAIIGPAMFAISIRAYTISSLISLRRSVVQAARSTLSAATALLRRTNLSALVPLESQRTAFTFRRKLSICGCPASTPSNCVRLLSVWLAAAWATILTRTSSTWTSAAFGSGVSTVLRISSPAINQDTGNPWQELFRAQRRARRCRRKNERFHPQSR